MLKRIAQNKTDAVVILILTAWPFAYFMQATLRQAVFAFGDIFRFFYPTHLAYAEALRQLRLPLWVPGMLDGFPLFAEGQIGALYPTHPLLYGLLPIDLATNYDILIQVAWVAIGTYLFARALKLKPASAFLAAFAFSNGGFFIPRLQHMSILATAAWMPWLLWAWEKYEQQMASAGRLRWFAILAFFSGIQLLGGHPQFALLSALLVALYSIVRWKPADAAPVRRTGFFEYVDLTRLVPVALVFGIGACLAAVQLLPTFELSGLTDRASGLLPKLFNAFSLRPIHYLMLLDPFLQGNPYPNVSVEVIGYIGLLPLFLALAAPLFRRDRRVFFFGFIAVLALFLGLGDLNPFYRMLRFVPLFSYFRVPSRFFFWYTFAAAILAAITFDALLERARPVLGLSRVQKLAYLGLAVLLGVVVGLVPSTPLSVWLSAWVWLPVVFAISAGWIVLRARRGLFARSTLIVLASAVSMIDLGCFAAVYAKTYDMMLPIADLDARPRVLDVLQGLSPQDGRVMTSLWIYPVQDTMRASLYPNVSMIYGVANAVGYTPLIMQRVSEYLDEMNAPMLNLSNARYYLRPQLLPVDAATEGSDLQNEFEPDFLGGRITFAPTAASQVTIVSSLAQSVDWPDGKPVATVTLYTENGDEYQFSLRAGLDTAEWAYERSDVRAIVKHSMPQVATTFPAYSAFPVEQHPGHNYLARFDVTQNGQPRRVTGVSVTPLVDPGLIHVEKLSFVSPDGIETSLASLIGRDDQTLIYRDAQHVAVFENPDALPRAFLVHDAIVADDETALGAMTRDDFKPQQELILSEGKALQAGGAQSPDEQVRIVDYADERVLVSVHASRPGYLLLADTWYPGWSASVDGAPTPITRADLIFRALPVTPGTHQVEFVFRPTSVYVGAAISGVGVLILLGIAIASRRRNA